MLEGCVVCVCVTVVYGGLWGGDKIVFMGGGVGGGDFFEKFSVYKPKISRLRRTYFLTNCLYNCIFSTKMS